jgi:hypothetical protein
MDSMRSLNKSLPRTTPAPATESPEELLQAFKAAALSVTKLYKTAAADQGKLRSEGYQDCLDDLLSFLDTQNIGLSDGEGWRIREWATSRLDGRELNLDDEDESEKSDHRASSPIIQRKQSTPSREEQTQTSTVDIPETISEDPTPAPTPTTSFTMPSLPTGAFTFRSTQTLPEIDMADHDDKPTIESSTISGTNAGGVTMARPARAGSRTPNSRNRHDRRAASGARIGAGAGHKRKVNFSEFFDIGDLGCSGNNLGGGGKRGRFV